MPPRRFCPRRPANSRFLPADLRREPRFDSQTLASRTLRPQTSCLHLPTPGAADCDSDIRPTNEGALALAVEGLMWRARLAGDLCFDSP
eukprot:3797898-Alexandrium_andersonii.AAC.1